MLLALCVWQAREHVLQVAVEDGVREVKIEASTKNYLMGVSLH
jgi:hypothetical protein